MVLVIPTQEGSEINFINDQCDQFYFTIVAYHAAQRSLVPRDDKSEIAL
ncbi:MAG: hypothetical protein JWR72_2621 [Flavisolibacter sp.]|jgi:hypothetical protein|nr:hypothetical protein [Flavisolibacter sp.]